MVIDAARRTFDMMEITNRRFMYNTNTCALILGDQAALRGDSFGSHAEDHGNSGLYEPFDSFIRGWIGTGADYKQGVIHFAPPINGKNPDNYVDGYNTLQMFRENGAGADTVVRGFPGAWEQPLSNILPGFMEKTKGENLPQVPMSKEKQQLLLGELAKIGFTEARYIAESDVIDLTPGDYRTPYIRGDDMIFYGSEYDSLVEKKIRPLVHKVNDMVAARNERGSDQRPSALGKLETAKRDVKPPTPKAPGKKKDKGLE